MPIITAIAPTKRDPTRASIRVERKHVATLSYKLIDDLGLAVGQSWDDEVARRVEQAAAYDKAFRDATRRLGRRAMSRKQLDDKLRQLEHAADIREQVLDRLTELGVLDDRAFGQALIRSVLAGKPAGPALLRQKLMQKGVDRLLIDELVHEATHDDDQQQQDAIDFAKRKLRAMQRLEPVVRKRRLYGQLARRGFTPDTINAAFDHLHEQIQEDAV